MSEDNTSSPPTNVSTADATTSAAGNQSSPFTLSAGPSTAEPLLKLADADRNMLAEALQDLLSRGSILGLEKGQSGLYQWCRQNTDMLREAAALAGLDVHVLHEERMVQALPKVPSLQLRLPKDATLVWLALWHVADVRWRDEGQPQALLTVEELNGVLKDTLLPDVASHPTQNRMREILRQAARYHLIDLNLAEPFEETGIEVLQAIRRVVPFQDFADWTRTAAAFTQGAGAEAKTATEQTSADNKDSTPPNTPVQIAATTSDLDFDLDMDTHTDTEEGA